MINGKLWENVLNHLMTLPYLIVTYYNFDYLLFTGKCSNLLRSLPTASGLLKRALKWSIHYPLAQIGNLSGIIDKSFRVNFFQINLNWYFKFISSYS
jgi:hypothetical protein